MKSLTQIQTESFYDNILMYLNTEDSLNLINRHIKCVERVLRYNDNGEIESERGYPLTSQEISYHNEVIKISMERINEVLINNCGAYIGSDESRQKRLGVLLNK